MKVPPLMFIWDGEAMHVPMRWLRLANQHYVKRHRYLLIPHRHRSRRSHNQYFAAIGVAWDQLPEDVAYQFSTEDDLRCWALIQAKFSEERFIVTASPEDALRAAATVKELSSYAIITVRMNVVHIITAKSQSEETMEPDEFQRSKQAVLEIVAGMIGVTVEQLLAEGLKR